MKRVISIFLVVGGLLSGIPSFAAGPFGTIHVGHWNGGVYPSDKDSSFSQCAGFTSYASGITVLVTYNAQNNWLLGFASKTFQLTKGESFPIDITFDG